MKICYNFYEVHFDNIYMSAKFAHISYTDHNCVKVQGVCQTRGWEIPMELFRTKLHDKKAVYRVRLYKRVMDGGKVVLTNLW